MRPEPGPDTIVAMHILEGPRGRYLIDGAVAAGLAVLVLSGLNAYSGTTLDESYRRPDAWLIILILLAALPLALRRRYPTTVMATVQIAWMIEVALAYPDTMSMFGLGVALHAVGSNLPPQRSRVVAFVSIGTALAWTGLGVLIQSDVAPDSLLTMGAFSLFAWLLGREVSLRQLRTQDLERRASAAERDREERAREAVTEERIRIARELHDVVAHDMTVMTVQAAAARRTLHRDPAKAEIALEAVEQAGHEALTEMRRLLGMLRTSLPEARTPQTGLVRITQLVTQLEEAGLPVELAIEGDARPLPPGIDLNAFRIIQESLTNALKHGGPDTRASLRLIYQPDRITIEINDDGRGAAEELATPGEYGHGLVGMRERVSLLGGNLTAGPRRGGGYRVRAELPLGAL